MYDVTNIDRWKYRMSVYLQTLGLHVYLAATRKFYLGNNKHIEANTQALVALRHTLSKEYLSMISHCDFAFAVWNTLTSPKLQTINYVEKEPLEDEYAKTCYMV